MQSDLLCVTLCMKSLLLLYVPRRCKCQLSYILCMRIW